MQADIIGVVLGVIGILIGIVGSYYFYKKSLRLKEPYWAIQSNNLIRDYISRVNDLKILYKGQEVKNLTVSKILFWNRGAETINRQDIQTLNPLRIIGIEDLQFLDAKILSINNTSSQFSIQLQEDGKSVRINFEYLDQDQGAVIQIIHTGISSKSVEITGDIKGVKKITNPGFIPIPMTSRFKPRMRRKIIALSFLFIILIVNIVAGFFFYYLSQSYQKISSINEIIIFILIIIANILVLGLNLNLWQPFSPGGLEIFEEEFEK